MDSFLKFSHAFIHCLWSQLQQQWWKVSLLSCIERLEGCDDHLEKISTNIIKPFERLKANSKPVKTAPRTQILIQTKTAKNHLIFDQQKIMYKDRTQSPHQLSYSAVTSYQSPVGESIHFKKQRTDQMNDKYGSNVKASIRNDSNSDLAFLRNTVGPSVISNNHHVFELKSEFKKVDSSLRQTMNISSNVKDFVKIQTPTEEKRSNRIQTMGYKLSGQKNDCHEVRKDDRLQKIMDKYQKKSETKQALKLLQQLKQLKRKQQQLKKQRKNDSQKQSQPLRKVTVSSYDVNSPINFSKKNKVEYYTPNYDKSHQSTSANSPQNQTYFHNRQKKTSHDLSRDEVVLGLSSQTFPRKMDNGNFTALLSGTVNKSTSNLKSYYEPLSSDLSTKPLTFAKHSTKDYLTSSNVADNKYERQYKPVSPYKPSISYVSTGYTLLNEAKDGTLKAKSPSSKYTSKDPSSYLPSSVSYSAKSNKYDNYSSTSFSSTPLKDIFMNKKVTINDFILGKNLGEGKFGVVYQAYDKKTKAVYALKKIPKSVIKSNWMIDQFLLEVKLQQFCNHPNILSLNGCFDDAQHVYIMLEYMEEGTLFLHLKKNTILPEKETSVRVKEIASAIQYLHQNGIAHRDLKPENIVMSHGVCKLCDFGWATICDQRRKTYCGTFDYAAPQILEGQEYDMSVDLWCLGILTYQILVGKAPFYHISRKQTMKKIMNCENEKINYPLTMSHEARDFIEQLLKRNPEQRLKSEDLLKHPFMMLADK